jgi:hypothetical protein
MSGRLRKGRAGGIARGHRRPGGDGCRCSGGRGHRHPVACPARRSLASFRKAPEAGMTPRPGRSRTRGVSPAVARTVLVARRAGNILDRTGRGVWGMWAGAVGEWRPRPTNPWRERGVAGTHPDVARDGQYRRTTRARGGQRHRRQACGQHQEQHGDPPQQGRRRRARRAGHRLHAPLVPLPHACVLPLPGRRDLTGRRPG